MDVIDFLFKSLIGLISSLNGCLHIHSFIHYCWKLLSYFNYFEGYVAPVFTLL